MFDLSANDPLTDSPLAANAARGRAAWKRLALSLQTITPSAIVRFALVSLAIWIVGRLAAESWFALLPFEVGLVVAYLTLPLVNGLDRFMPRPIAALTVVALEAIALVLSTLVLVRPLAEQVSNLAAGLPKIVELESSVVALREFLSGLPEPLQPIIAEALRNGTTALRDNFGVYAQVALSYGIASTLGLLNLIGFILGFLAVPTWLLSVLTDQRAGVRALNRVLPDWLRDDFWAVVRIFDRSFGTYLRGVLLQAFAVASGIFAGFLLLENLNVANIPYPLVLALIAGIADLIPVVGPILGVIPALIAGFSVSNESGLAVLGLYILVQWLVGAFLGSRIEQRAVAMHPAVLATIVVALSQFGLIWLLLAAPTAAVVRDLYRYVYGRFGEPPRPAGLLPGEPLPAPIRQRPVPLVSLTSQSARDMSGTTGRVQSQPP